MSSSIDERVVRMKFDNAQFGQGVSSTMSMLDKLKAALKLDGASSGIDAASNAANKFNTNEAQGQVSALSAKFSALQVAAITALSNIVSKAVDAGVALAKSLTFDPVMSGFHEYETNLNSIQTILANTGLKGAEGLGKVNHALEELNHYADQTIYNFSEMARNVGTFTAAGVSLDKATSAIKGIANLAALSGSNSEQASTAMYQLSQAISAGKVTLEDWNSVVNAGMGGKVFQDSLMETARAHGVAVDKIVKDEGSFRLSLQKGWLTSDILTQTLSKFTGDLTADQLKSMGYNKQQIAGILEMAKTASDAATKIKTFTQLIDTLREAVGSGWSKTFQILFGDFDEAKSLFTDVNNVLGAMVNSSADARNNLLQGWKDLGGRQALIDGISNAFHALMSILTPIKDAFREIFPATTAQQLYNATAAFRDFMAKLKLGSETADNLRRTFAGFFAILGIGWELVKAGVGFIFDLLGSFTKGSGGLLKFSANIGDFLVNLHQAIKDGDAFGKVFDVIAKVIQVPISLIKTLAKAIGSLFKGTEDAAGSAKESIFGFTQTLTPLEKVSNMLKSLWASLGTALMKLGEWIKKTAGDFMQWAAGVGAAISGVFSGGLNFDAILKAVNTGLFAGLFLLLKKFLGSLKDISLDGGLIGSIKDALDGITGALKGMQNALNAAALLGIAISIGILALSMTALSKIDSGGLTRAGIAIGVLFTQMTIAFKALDFISSMGSAVKIGILSAGLILLAIAINILVLAVKNLSEMDWAELAKGMAGLVGILAALVVTTKLMETNNPGIIKTGAALILLAVAVRLLVSSVEALGGMNWAELAKGLTGVATLLLALALFTKLADADKAGFSSGLGIILLATGLKILVSVVQDFAKLDWGSIAKGMAGIGVGLGLIAGAMNLIPAGAIVKAAGIVIVAAALEIIADAVGKMGSLSWSEIAKGMTVMAGALLVIGLALALLPPSSIVSAAGILIVAGALEILAKVMGKLGGMSWIEIAKSLVVLAGALVIIVAAMILAEASLPGAAAILVMAAALAILAPVLVMLGGMSWSDIAAGLTVLAGAFIIIGAAGIVLGLLSPLLMAMALAIGVLGVAMLAAGVGVLAFGAGLTLLAGLGAGAVAAIVGIVKGLVGLIPFVMEEIAKGLVAFAKVIATAGPAMVDAMTAVMLAILDSIGKVTPRIIDTLTSMLLKMLDAIEKNMPKMVDSGVRIINSFLSGVANNIGSVIAKGTDVIVAFIRGIGDAGTRIVQAGIDTIVKFMNALADQIRAGSRDMSNAGENIARAIVEGISNGIKNLAPNAVRSVISMAQSMVNAALNILKIFSPSRVFHNMGEMVALGAALGVDDNAHIAATSAENLGNDMIDAMSKSLTGLSAVLGSDLIDFNPTITPVLDLTQVTKDAAKISDLLSLPSFDTSSTLTSANNASSGFDSNRTDDGNEGAPAGETKYTFNQTNNSPKSLSEIEIYRQTDNLISKTKGVKSA